MKNLSIAIGSDHAGYETKNLILDHLKNQASVKDFGTYSEESTDYPDYAHAVSSAIENGEFDLGILVCGSGNGINMAANKHKGIRAALCWNPEIAGLARNHNNANVLSIPGRYVSKNDVIEIVDAFLNAEFEGGRHQKRVDKI